MLNWRVLLRSPKERVILGLGQRDIHLSGQKKGSGAFSRWRTERSGVGSLLVAKRQVRQDVTEQSLCIEEISLNSKRLLFPRVWDVKFNYPSWMA